MKNKRIILDTNLWISFLISKKFLELDKLIKKNKFVLVFSDESLEEFIEVVKRPKFKKLFPKRDVEKILEAFDQYGELVKVTSKTAFCRDAKDNFLLNLSVDGNVDYLVTGDNDLLVLKEIEKTEILTYRALLEKIGKI